MLLPWALLTFPKLGLTQQPLGLSDIADQETALSSIFPIEEKDIYSIDLFLLFV